MWISSFPKRASSFPSSFTFLRKSIEEKCLEKGCCSVRGKEGKGLILSLDARNKQQQWNQKGEGIKRKMGKRTKEGLMGSLYVCFHVNIFMSKLSGDQVDMIFGWCKIFYLLIISYVYVYIVLSECCRGKCMKLSKKTQDSIRYKKS